MAYQSDQVVALVNAGKIRQARKLAGNLAGAAGGAVMGYAPAGGKATGGGGFGGSGTIPNEPDVGSGDVGKTCGPGQTPGSRPYAFICSDVLAAGAVTAGTAAFDFYDSAQSADISTNNTIPGQIKTFGARLFVGAQLNTIAANETEAAFATFYIREIHQGAEIARYPIYKVGLRFGNVGVLTVAQGGAASSHSGDVPPHGVKWERDFDNDFTYSKELHTNITVTTISITDWTVVYASRIAAH